jgi:hypothetical protein
MTSERILEWLDKLTTGMPVLCGCAEFQAAELRALLEQSAGQLSTHVIALLWLRIGEIDRPHALVQEDPSSMGSYLHGVVHRLEGDYGNANYWFQRVRDPSLVQDVGKGVVNRLISNNSLKLATRLGVVSNETFLPCRFVSFCESHRDSPKHSELIEAIGLAEWQSLWAKCETVNRPRKNG